MLIVNADDLGRNPGTTDAILACHSAQRLHSTSAMVYMCDSQRAAELALRCGIEVGLHLNFSEAFTDPGVPAKVRAAQAGVVGFLRSSKYALLVYNPFLGEAFRYVFEAQREEFVRLYGKEPAHYDGHQHMHLATNLLLNPVIPAGVRVRRSFSFAAGEKSLANRWYRRAVDARLAKRYRLTDYFFSIARHLSASRLAHVIELAQGANVELMTHPAITAEYDFMMSNAFGELMRKAGTRACAVS